MSASIRRLPASMTAIRCSPELVEMLLSSSRLSKVMVLRLDADLIAARRTDLEAIRAEMRRFGVAVEHRW